MRIDADTNVWSRDRTVDGEGGGVDGGTFDAKYLKYIEVVSNSKIFAVNSFHSTRRYIGTAVGPLHPALHRNGA